MSGRRWSVSRRGACLAPAALAFVLLAAAACDTQTPLERLQAQLETYPEYSVVLQDMNEALFGYSHQYPGRRRRAAGGVGRAGLSRSGSRLAAGRFRDLRALPAVPRHGRPLEEPRRQRRSGRAPAGYQQVGDQRYGQWRQESGGRSFWEFYGQYALLSHIVGGFGRPIYRDDWNGYRDARGRGQTYYGPSAPAAAARTARTAPPPARPAPTSSAASRRRGRRRRAGRSANGSTAACRAACAASASSRRGRTRHVGGPDPAGLRLLGRRPRAARRRQVGLRRAPPEIRAGGRADREAQPGGGAGRRRLLPGAGHRIGRRRLRPRPRSACSTTSSAWRSSACWGSCC